MKRIAGALAALALLSGCSGAGPDVGEASTPSPAPSPSPVVLRTFGEVARVACGSKRVAQEAEPEFLTTASGNCGDVALATFQGPNAQRQWLAFGTGPVLIGANWAVAIDNFDPMPEYRRIQAVLGGRVVTAP